MFYLGSGRAMNSIRKKIQWFGRKFHRVNDTATSEDIACLGYVRRLVVKTRVSYKRGIVDVDTKIQSKVASKSDRCSRTTFLCIAFF